MKAIYVSDETHARISTAADALDATISKCADEAIDLWLVENRQEIQAAMSEKMQALTSEV